MSETVPQALIDFVLARIDEDEDRAQSLGFGDTGDPRAVAECKAKRRIVEQAAIASDQHHSLESEFRTSGDSNWEPDPGYTILRALAAVDADHPEFRPEWAL